MRLLFLAKRWHLWRHRLAKWLLVWVNRLAQRLAAAARDSGSEANALNDKARMRLEVCQRCPVFNAGWCDRQRGGCGCYMPAKVQIDAATCPKSRW